MDIPVKCIDTVEGPSAGVLRQLILLRYLPDRGLLVVAKIRNSSAGEPDEVPGVKVSRVEHGVLGEEQQ